MHLRSAATAVLAFAVSLSTIACHSESIEHGPIPPPTADLPLATSPGRATAVFAGGCFWGTQAVFERVKGVLATTAGYSGGSAHTANYDDVSAETTDHAESVEVVYDPSRLTYGQLLRVFFTIHDPTTLNRQGPDTGTSYRSAIFYANDDQKRIAEAYIAQLDAAHAWKHKHRHPGRPPQSLLPRRGLPPGLRPQKSQQPLHPGLRPPQDLHPQSRLPRALRRIQRSLSRPSFTDPAFSSAPAWCTCSLV